jgi:CRISPR-associated endonuclease/helicase Cas3
MLDNPPDCADDGKKDYRLAEDRLFSLSNYSRRFFSATVDQFLSFLQHGYGGICMSVALADAVVIIDEIHSFDQQLFNTLLAHLKFLQIPTLCMTATLQKERSAELNACRIQVFPGPGDRQELQDLAKKEQHPRYRFVREVDVANLIPLAVKMATEGNERILWVVNTVARCQELCQQLTQELKPEFGDRVIAYHSRFRLMDRDARHQQAVAKFRFDSNSAGLIAVTTQVCEMSLDLDADRLITELAPIPSLIQRCGRANRHESRGQDFVAQVHIYMPENHKPYDREDLRQADRMAADIGQNKQGVSQRDLSDAMMQYGTNIELGLKAQSLLFESGYFAKPGELRDIDEYTVPAILDSDLDVVQDHFAKKKPLDAYIVPVPERFALKSGVGWLPAYLRCAPAAQYCKALGFLDEGKRNG